jgi:hypothetical protein
VSNLRGKLPDLAVLGGIVAVAVATFVSLSAPEVLDCDVANLAMGIERFDIHQHQPHPPGYLGYVLLLRALHFITRAEPLDVARLLSRLFAVATIFLGWAAARAFVSDDKDKRTAGLAAALFIATHPIILYYGVDGQTHSAEAAMAAALVWALASEKPHPVAVGLILAAGGSLRPSFAVCAVPPVLWLLRPRPFSVRGLRPLIVVGILGALGTAAWFIPTVVMAGGLQKYRATSDALIGSFVRLTSPLSETRDPRLTAINLRDTAWWAAIALLPSAIVAFGWRRLGAEARRALVIVGLMAAPSLVFYALVLCAEAGYLAGLVPPAMIATALAICRLRFRPVFVALVASAQLAFFFFVPINVGGTFMLPTVDEIVARETRARILHEAALAGVEPGKKILVLSDWPDPTIMRQLPLRHPNVDVAILYTKRKFTLGETGMMTLATAHGWLTAPGDALNTRGTRREVVTPTCYDFIAVDPRATQWLRAELRAQTRCTVPDADRERYSMPHLPASCFPSAIRYEDFTLRYCH